MSTGFDVVVLRNAIQRVADAAEAAKDELVAADGVLGDGDLGLTVADGWREAARVAPDLPNDLGLAFMDCAKAFQRVCASSFGTLSATGLIAASGFAKGRTSIGYGEISVLIGKARDAMMRRGKGALGDKTVLDLLDAIAIALEGCDNPSAMTVKLHEVVAATLATFRDRPCKLGRARFFGEKSVGIDDPGMLAVARLTEAFR